MLIFISSLIDKIGPETLFFMSIAVMACMQLFAVATDE